MKKTKIAAIVAASVLSVSAVPKAEALEEPVIKELSTLTTVFGDVNGDNTVSGNDVLALIQYFLHRYEELPPEMSLSFTNSDINRSGALELTDLATLKQYVVGDKVSMGGKSFDSSFDKSEDHPLVNVKQKFFIPHKGLFCNYSTFSINSYRELTETLELLEMNEYSSLFDDINMPDAPSYDSSESYDIALFIPLNNTSLNANNNVSNYRAYTKLKLNTERNGDLWASADGLEIVDEPGNFNSMAVYIVNCQAAAKLLQQFNGYDLNGRFDVYRNSSIIPQSLR